MQEPTMGGWLREFYQDEAMVAMGALPTPYQLTKQTVSQASRPPKTPHLPNIDSRIDLGIGSSLEVVAHQEEAAVGEAVACLIQVVPFANDLVDERENLVAVVVWEAAADEILAVVVDESLVVQAGEILAVLVDESLVVQAGEILAVLVDESLVVQAGEILAGYRYL
jgi:hypothetical protein